MDDETLEEFIHQLMEQSGNNIGIVWQGGEPSLAGAGFFRKAIALMQKYGEGKSKTISNLFKLMDIPRSDDSDVLYGIFFLMRPFNRRSRRYT